MSSSLPPGWTSAIDPSSGKMYYANPATGESSWIPPPPHVQLPPPPPPTHYRPPFQGAHQQSSTNTDTTSTNVSTVSSIVALASSGLLVPAARAIVDSNNTTEGTDQESERKRLELRGLSPGQIADLCAIQREEMAERQAEYKPYTPINPHALNNTARREPMEPGRLEIRIHSLYNHLRKIQEKKA